MKQFIKKIDQVLDFPELIWTKVEIREFIKPILQLKKSIRINPTTIIDIGAARGLWSAAARFAFPDSQIYAFEPIQSNLDIIDNKFVNDKKFKSFNCALSDMNGETTFWLNSALDSSSLLTMTDVHKNEFPQSKDETKITVKTFRLDELSDLDLFGQIFIKMDVQGAELLVLKGAEKILDNVDWIKLELNFERFYDNQAKYTDIFNFMDKHNYSSFIQSDLIFSSKTNKLLASDITFIKQK
jgi:FkbM family methyltransferase